MISMACVPKPLEEEEDSQIKIELHDHVHIPVRYASLERVYSVSSSSSSLCCTSAADSHNVISKKVNPQKLPISDASEGYGCPDNLELRPHPRPEIVRVYRRRRRRRPESILESAMAQNKGVERKDGIGKIECAGLDENDFYEKKKKQKRRRVGNGELMKLGVDSSSLSVSTTPRLRGCRINAVCSGNKQNGSSRSKKNSVKKVVPPSATAKKWVRLGFTYHIFLPLYLFIYPHVLH